VAAVPGYSQKPLAEVTQAEIRECVAKWLKDNPENRKEYGLDANGLEYTPPAGPLVWKLQAKVANAQRENTDTQVRDFLKDALQPLIKAEDLNTLWRNARVDRPADTSPQPGGNPPRQPDGNPPRQPDGNEDALNRAVARAEDAARRAAAAEAAADNAAADAAWRAKAADAAGARAAVAAARARAALDAAAPPRMLCMVSYDTTFAAIEPACSYRCCHRLFGGCRSCGRYCKDCFSGAPGICQPSVCGAVLQSAQGGESWYLAIETLFANVRLRDETVLQSASMVPIAPIEERKTHPSVQLVSLKQQKAVPPPNFGLAIAHYSKGYSLFWQCRYQAALDEFDQATESFSDDARFWYFKGFAELGLGRQEAAEVSLGRAVSLHSRNQPEDREIAHALQRVQGEFRQKLKEVQLKASLLPSAPTSPIPAGSADRVAARL